MTAPMPDAGQPVPPFTPVECPHPGCHWAVFGIPDRYADARAQHLAGHLAEAHGGGDVAPAVSDADTAMPDARLAEIEALADAATPGPWEARLSHQRKTGQLAAAQLVRPPKNGSNVPDIKSWKLDNVVDLQFASAARTAVPELVAEVRRLRAENADAQQFEDFHRRSAEHVAAKRDELEAEVKRLRDKSARAADMVAACAKWLRAQPAAKEA